MSLWLEGHKLDPFVHRGTKLRGHRPERELVYGKWNKSPIKLLKTDIRDKGPIKRVENDRLPKARAFCAPGAPPVV